MRPSYSIPDRRAEYCDESVCLSVCLSVRDHISGTTRPIFTKYFVLVTYGRGSVLLWRRNDTLCTSGFMDDVMFAHKPRLINVAAQLKRGACSLGLGYKLSALNTSSSHLPTKFSQPPNLHICCQG